MEPHSPTRRKRGHPLGAWRSGGLVSCLCDTGLLLRQMGRHYQALEKLDHGITLEAKLNHPDQEEAGVF